MNQRTNVNTVPVDTQAKSITLPLLQISTLRQQLGDVESQTYTASALGEIAAEKLEVLSEASVEKVVLEAVIHLEALVVAIRRSIEVIRDAIPAISITLEEVEGGAQ